MKNTEEYQLKKCIFIVLEDFQRLIEELTNGLKEAEYELDGLYFSDSEEAIKTSNYWKEDILVTLSNYFDVTVTSVHADDCGYLGVWICYKENDYPSSYESY